jgi:hypothetical protein
MPSTPSVLLLYALPGETASTVSNHIRALETLLGYECRSLNVAWQLPARLDLDRFDVVIIHYSLMASEDLQGPISLLAESIERLGTSRAIKCVFMQDEHRNVKRTISALRALHADVFFTCMPENIMRSIYPESELPGMDLVNVLTGYVDEDLLGRNLVTYSARPIDVGYRARKTPFWLGKLAQEKWTIAERFQRDAEGFGLACDISTLEQDRLYGEKWIRFLANCKAVLGTESGASVVDIDGTIRTAVDAAVAQTPNLSFEEAQARFFADVDGRFSMAQISPRCFEAAAMKTLMVLYPGEYSGRLTPFRHYVPLQKDHSNMREVVEILRNPDKAQPIIEAAYRECALARQNSHQALQDAVHAAVEEKMRGHVPAERYTDGEWPAIEADNRRTFERARRLRVANATLSRLMNGIFPGGRANAFRDRIARPLRAVLLRR